MTEEQKQAILRLYHDGWMSIEIAEQTGFSVSAICRFLKKMGLPRQNRKHCSTAQQQEIVQQYQQGATIRQLAQEYPQFTEDWINGLLRKYKVTRRNGPAPHLNEHYFQNIDSERKAYFLGLLYADGHIDHTHNGRNYCISLSLNEEDGYLIEEWKKAVATNLEVKHYTRTRADGQLRHTATLTLYSKEMYEDLLAAGMTEHKVENLNHLPKLPDELMRHFVRGYFDGDGSVFISHSRTGALSLGANFCGSEAFLAELNAYLNQHIHCNSSKGRHPFNRGAYASLHLGTNSLCIQLFHLLYDSPCTIYMQRKYNKFQEIPQNKQDMNEKGERR